DSPESRNPSRPSGQASSPHFYAIRRRRIGASLPPLGGDIGDCRGLNPEITVLCCLTLGFASVGAACSLPPFDSEHLPRYAGLLLAIGDPRVLLRSPGISLN